MAWLLSLAVLIGVSIYAIRDKQLKFKGFIQQIDAEHNEAALENHAETSTWQASF